MAKTHYDVLGVTPSSTAAEVRTAFRKLVMLHHPDRSDDPGSKALFLAATGAYEVLGDLERRREYDRRLGLEREAARRKPPPPRRSAASRPEQKTTPSAKLAAMKQDVARLDKLFSSGRYGEAELLARTILKEDSRQPMPYAILGDLARQRGNVAEALKLYAFAAQYEPRNPAFQRRYEELLGHPHMSGSRHGQESPQMFGAVFGLAVILLACVYLVLAKESPVLPNLKFISTWTVGMIAMLFFSGVSLGACLSIDGLLDSFAGSSKTALGRISPSVALASIAVVNFWAAIVMYVLIGWRRRSFSFSTSRIIAIVAAGTCLLALAAEAGGTISGEQVVCWGGNVVYLGALCGWMVTDALRASG